VSKFKTSGREFKAWYASDWGVDAYWDDYAINVNGEEAPTDFDPETLADTDKVTVYDGIVMWGAKSEFSADACKLFRAWEKSQTTTTVAVDVQKDRLDAFRELVAAFTGAKLVQP
jgi:hypothetical protein